MNATAALTTLTHSGLQVPAAPKLAVTSYKGHNTYDGVAFTCTLRADGKIIGTVENSGHGGGTEFHPNTVRGEGFGYAEFNAYAAQCRNPQGEEVLAERVLDDLVTEYEWTKKITKATPKGRSVLRLMDFILWGNEEAPSGDAYAHAEAEATTPTNDAQRASLAAQVTAQLAGGSEYSWWQIWTGERWENLTTPKKALAAAE